MRHIGDELHLELLSRNRPLDRLPHCIVGVSYHGLFSVNQQIIRCHKCGEVKQDKQAYHKWCKLVIYHIYKPYPYSKKHRCQRQHTFKGDKHI